jgi:dTDP-glucose 4,6-dehydratase
VGASGGDPSGGDSCLGVGLSDFSGWGRRMTERVLVIGGAGFIGAAVVRHLIGNTTSEVAVLNTLTYAVNLESLASVADSPRYRFYQLDICDSAGLAAAFAELQPTAVMDLTAEANLGCSSDGPSDFVQPSIVGTYSLLEAVRRYWLGLAPEAKAAFRFHHMSTDEVYGEQEGAEALFSDNAPHAARAIPRASRPSSVQLVRAWQRTYGLPALVTTCSNNYGPFHFPETLIPQVILSAFAGKPLPVQGDGSQVRDWLYVEDHARALVEVVTNGQVGKTYGIGGQNRKRNLEVVEAICEVLDELVPLEADAVETRSYKQLITVEADLPVHERPYAIEASKIERELGWVPQETFESGIRKTVEWYLDSYAWWQ